jgi:biotin carboxyl carrier protein
VQVRIGDKTFEIDVTNGDSWRVDGQDVSVRSAVAGPYTTHLVIDGESHVVTVEQGENGGFRATVDGHVIDGVVKDRRALLLERYGMTNGAEAAERTVRAPMPGLVVRVLVERGEPVEAGQDVVVLEAMKMENVLRAPAAGTVGTVHATEGTAVGKGDLLLEID